MKKSAQADLAFEISWEVCNKVGGIYTVVMSKAALMKKNFSRYVLIGPYFEDRSKFEFEHEDPPEDFKPAFDEMAKEGVICHYGTWGVKGEPSVILLDFSTFVAKKNDIKKKLWEDYKIDSIKAGWDYEEPMVWSTAAGMLIEKILHHVQGKVSVQCHEWMSGFALLYLKSKKLKVGTVFTTHATMLGRSLAGNNRDLYNELDKINPDEEAYKYKVEAKHLAEKACAKNTDAFTTVSEITALEAEKFLGRKADVLVLNGLDMKKFPTIEETSIKHITVREKIREFLTYYFFPYYSYDLQHDLIFFILGRYEFRNKGLDIFIRALGKLNERMKEEDAKRSVSVFFWIPAQNSGIKTDVLENKNYYRHIKNFVNFHSEEIINRIVSDIVSQKKLAVSNIFSDEFMDQVKKDILHFKRKGDPPLSTHYMDDMHDAMLSEMRRNGLNNKAEDKVKTIVYPVYLDGADDMLNLNYYDTIAGCHLGVFPSYYEPWGYTPLEGAALGVPSLTTDLSGFGMFIKKHKKRKQQGIFILDRLNKKEEDVVEEFTNLLHTYTKFTHEERVHNKTVAKDLAQLADWGKLIENYVEAHNIAIKKAY